MKTVYVVGWYEDAEVVCETRAAAEEYILTLAENNAYEDYLYNARQNYRYADILFNYGRGMWIQEVEVY